MWFVIGTNFCRVCAIHCKKNQSFCSNLFGMVDPERYWWMSHSFKNSNIGRIICQYGPSYSNIFSTFYWPRQWPPFLLELSDINITMIQFKICRTFPLNDGRNVAEYYAIDCLQQKIQILNFLQMASLP